MTARLADTPVLETPRLILRAPQASDYPAWESFFLSDRATFIGGGTQFDSGRAWRAFAAITGHWSLRGCGVFVLTDRDSGAPLGGCGPWYPELWPEREVGWTLWTPAAEGRGLMAEAAQAVLDHVYTVLGWTTAVSYIDPKNTRSIALAERLGATHDAAARGPQTGAERDDFTLVYRHAAPLSGSDSDGGMEAYA